MATGTVSRREFLRRVGLGGLGVLAAGGFLTSGGNAAYARSHDGGVFPGVTVAGIALGGLTAAAARERLAARFAEYRATALPVGIAGAAARWQVTPASLGASADLDSAITAALAVGRQGGPLADLGERLGARLGGSDLPLSARLDGERLVAALGTWAPEVTGASTDAAFADGGASGLTIVPDRAGRGLDPDGSQAAFLARFATLSTAPVELPVVGVPAAITAADLEAVRVEANALVASPLTLRIGERSWTVEGALLRASLVYRRAPDDELEPGLRAEQLRPFLGEIAATIATPATDAWIAQDESGRYRITTATPGAILDESGTVAALGAALREGRREASVALTPQAPQTTAADLEPAFARLDAILNTPLVVAFEEFTRTYDRATIAPLLVITPRPATAERIAFSLDETELAALVADLAKTMDQEPRDARFKWVDGAVQDVANGQDGRAVQLAPTQAAIAAAILGATGRATPIVTVTKPAVPVADKATIVIRDRLGRGQTNYYGGVANRVHNVELSASRLDGALIPPNGIFSFNDTTGAQTLENGYKQGYGIALVGGPDGGKGNIKTVPSIGGGVCQVSTTLFQAVYAAGLPIEERNWHSLWLMTYDPANSPTAKKGLDATVDDQSGLDFRFQNTTGGWLAVEAVADGASLNIALIGVDPGWQIQNDEPIITNIKPADPAPVYEKTHDLPPGEQLPVESAVDGFDAANRTRVLDKNGTVLRDKTFTSNYAPSRNVIQIGVPPNEPLT
jgi:vancomycin resistance protein YoaR